MPTDVISTIEGSKAEHAPADGETLSLALLRWRSRHNESAVRLDAKVLERPEFEGAAGDRWLSRAQVVFLQDAMDKNPFRERWLVKEIEWNGYGRECTFEIGTIRLRLPADQRRESGLRLADLSPTSLILAAFWAAAEVTEIGNKIPWTMASIPTISYIIAAIQADAMVRRRGQGAQRDVALMASAIGILQAALTAIAVRGEPLTPSGVRRVPIQHATLTPTLLWAYMLGQDRKNTTAKVALTAIGLAAWVNILSEPTPRASIVVVSRWIANVTTGVIAYGGGRRIEQYRSQHAELVRQEMEATRAETRRAARLAESRRIAATAHAVRQHFMKHPAVASLVDRARILGELRSIERLHGGKVQE